MSSTAPIRREAEGRSLPGVLSTEIPRDARRAPNGRTRFGGKAPPHRGRKARAGASDAAPEARERIFLAAEKLFAERGFDGVSVRDIVQAAEVNLAAVSYYFGSKSELLLAVFRARARELNRERLALLREAEARQGGEPPLADVLRALMGPPILWRDPASGKDTASRFIARAMAEVTPDLRKILESDVSHLRGFLAALTRALPHLSKPEVCWALHFTVALPHQCTDTHFRRPQGAVGRRLRHGRRRGGAQPRRALRDRRDRGFRRGRANRNAAGAS